MFFPPYAAELGTENKRVALLLSIIGVSDLIGRVFGGWFADLGLLKRHYIMAICLTFTGMLWMQLTYVTVTLQVVFT